MFYHYPVVSLVSVYFSSKFQNLPIIAFCQSQHIKIAKFQTYAFCGIPSNVHIEIIQFQSNIYIKSALFIVGIYRVMPLFLTRIFAYGQTKLEKQVNIKTLEGFMPLLLKRVHVTLAISKGNKHHLPEKLLIEVYTCAHRGTKIL